MEGVLNGVRKYFGSRNWGDDCGKNANPGWTITKPYDIGQASSPCAMMIRIQFLSTRIVWYFKKCSCCDMVL